MKLLKYLLLSLLLITFHSYGSSPKIILKLDDYKVQNNSCKGIQVLAFLKEKKVKAGFGVIAAYCDPSSRKVLSEYLCATNDKAEKLFEVWNHGYDHIKPEFKETPFDYQKKHFLMADSIIEANLGVQAHTFGAPYNANDSNTLQVIQSVPRYKTVYFSQIKPTQTSGILNLSNRVNLEISTGVPDSAAFVTSYLVLKDKFTDYVVLQAHPPHFTAASFEQFKKVINYLIKEGCEFVLPYEYFSETKNSNRK